MNPSFSEMQPASSNQRLRSTDETFRIAMRRHAAGVCVITLGEGEEVNGMAATAVTSFSMDPPSLLICVNGTASIAKDLTVGACFGVTFLGRRHEEIVALFSRKPSGRPRFVDPAWRFEPDGRPWLADAVANLNCKVQTSLAYATHVAVIGDVLSGELGPEGPSLIYRDGCFL